MIMCITIIYLFILEQAATQFEGDRCTLKTTHQKGKCVQLDSCDYAKDLLKIGQRPQHCGFKGFTPIVCCPVTTKLVPGQRSEKYCDVYYPKPSIPFRKFVLGGKQSLAKEFPHMALLGYGDKTDVQWLCGGSLISENFVLTAAHCIVSQEFGMIRWVRLGDLDITNDTDDAKPQNFTVVNIYVYPEYLSSSYYHDIALVKLDKSVEFDDYVKPACLHTGRNISTKLVATGWGATDFSGKSSSHLMKVELDHVSYEKCESIYANTGSRLKSGILEDIQICAGHSEGKDTCLGDSGGPLQFKVSKPTPHYSVVGITSFGKPCGIPNSIGVYTRIATYIDWIEDIVWPFE